MSDSVIHIHGDAVLDNPIWNSLASDHSDLALGARSGNGLARRYPSHIGPLAALQKPTSEAFSDLATIVPHGDIAVLFLEEKIAIPSDWQVLRSGALVQMVCPMISNRSFLKGTIIPLKTDDIPEMVALARLTEPGPFREQTARLGGFVGIHVDGRLAAMAGRRLSPNGFGEVSAVCTHPDFRGRGYALALVDAVARHIHAEGRIPFLTTLQINTEALRVYQRAGFFVRRTLQLAILEPSISTRP